MIFLFLFYEVTNAINAIGNVFYYTLCVTQNFANTAIQKKGRKKGRKKDLIR